jgi:hypothetical protein
VSPKYRAANARVSAQSAVSPSMTSGRWRSRNALALSGRTHWGSYCRPEVHDGPGVAEPELGEVELPARAREM